MCGWHYVIKVLLTYLLTYLRSKVISRCFCFREYEKDSSTVLEQLSEKDQSKTDGLLKRKLLKWGNQHMFSLAEKVDGIDFVRNNCCQSYLDKTWIGRTRECKWAHIKVIVQFTLWISAIFTGRISCCCRAKIARRYMLLYSHVSVVVLRCPSLPVVSRSFYHNG